MAEAGALFVTEMSAVTVSSFVIVPVPSASEIVALVAFDRWTVKVSSGSTATSPFTSTVIVLVVSLELKFRVPVFAT